MSTKTKTTDNPCEDCGSHEFEVYNGFVGYMGSRPAYEDEYTCLGCGKKYRGSAINNLYEIPEDL